MKAATLLFMTGLIGGLRGLLILILLYLPWSWWPAWALLSAVVIAFNYHLVNGCLVSCNLLWLFSCVSLVRGLKQWLAHFF